MPSISGGTTLSANRRRHVHPKRYFRPIYTFLSPDKIIFWFVFFIFFFVLGHYLFIESSSPRILNDTARLFSPVYGAPESSTIADEGVCFTFWFHMYGSTTGECSFIPNNLLPISLSLFRELLFYSWFSFAKRRAIVRLDIVCYRVFMTLEWPKQMNDVEPM